MQTVIHVHNEYVITHNNGTNLSVIKNGVTYGTITDHNLILALVDRIDELQTFMKNEVEFPHNH